MPRYQSTSPFEQVLVGLSVGVDGTTVTPADGRPAPADGTTVVLAHGDVLETTAPYHFPGAAELDQPAPTPTAAPAEEPAP